METIIVKMEEDPSASISEAVETTTTQATLKKLLPVKAKHELKGGEPDIVPREVLENTIEVPSGYFERFLAKRKSIFI